MRLASGTGVEIFSYTPATQLTFRQPSGKPPGFGSTPETRGHHGPDRFPRVTPKTFSTDTRLWSPRRYTAQVQLK